MYQPDYFLKIHSFFSNLSNFTGIYSIGIMKLIWLLILLLSLSPVAALAQGEAFNWYFGNMAALNFSSGSPVSLTNSKMFALAGCASLSDSLGNLLFYSNGTTIWNRNHMHMLNGTGLMADEGASQAALGLKAPGTDHTYYIFTVGGNHTTPTILGAYYSIIDMSLDGGLGGVLPWQKNIPLQGADSARDVITAVACANQEGYWVFVRNFSVENKMLAYLIDKTGIHQTPAVSPCLHNFDIGGQAGTSKASPDGRYLIYGPSGWHISIPLTELYELDSYTGLVNPIFLFNSLGINSGTEFSANSEFLYLSSALDSAHIVQYDMNYLSDPVSFQDNKYVVYSKKSSYWEFKQMQLAPDGKIYISQPFGPDTSKFLSVISNPSLKGVSCGFQYCAVPLISGRCNIGLPTFIQSYFARFIFVGECLGSSTRFTSRFYPTPDSIAWDFDDPGSGSNNFSDSINPVHVFSDTGTFHVKTVAFYLNGHQEAATRLVKISSLPAVYLGPDKTVCPNSPVVLDAGSGFTSYQWNTGQNTPSVQVSDTGMYWVRVKDSKGCMNNDTIHIKSYPVPTVDESNLVLSPTTCGGSTGAVSGLSITGTPPITIEWKNGNNLVISDSINLFHLPVDNYRLFVFDGNGCTWPSKNYTVNDVGDVLIDTVLHSDSHCGKDDGKITVVATTGLAAMLKYSLDNGQSYAYNLGKFQNLAPGTYRVKVMVSDTAQPCQKVYDFNPVTINNLSGPVVTNVSSQFETGNHGDGSITIQASTAYDTLFYSAGGIEQVNNGTFNNLHSGTYNCKVADQFGCDTTFIVIVNNLTIVRLQAIAGDGSACLGNVAVLPLLANHFSHVGSFSTQLKYNKTLVTCQNYLNANPALADSLVVDLFPSLGELSISWTGKNPVNLQDGSTLVELSFASLMTGQDSLKWDIAPGICTFLDSLGNTIQPEFKQGQMRIYTLPQGSISAPAAVCEGAGLSLLGIYTPGSGNGSIRYRWTGPGGLSVQETAVSISTVTQVNSGEYTLSLSDTNHCESIYKWQVNVVPAPVAGFTRDTLFFDEQTILEAAQGYDHYSWNTGDSTYFVLVTSEGWYKVTLKTAEGCMSTDSVMMLYSFVPLDMPNAFTPNGDGKNDFFLPVTYPDKISSFSMYIFNRWGQKICSTSDLGRGWDGTFEGKPAPLGVYTYIITYSNQSGETRKKTGVVTLVR